MSPAVCILRALVLVNGALLEAIFAGCHAPLANLAGAMWRVRNYMFQLVETLLVV